MNLNLKEMANRKGPRPETEGPIPHRQISQWPSTDIYAKRLHDFAVSLSDVANGISHVGDGGLSAFFLTTAINRGWTSRFLIDNEFAHIHVDESHSLHLVLPNELGLILQKKGWTEQHPLGRAGAIPNTNFMLFGARDEEELEISRMILNQSWDFARQKL